MYSFLPLRKHQGFFEKVHHLITAKWVTWILMKQTDSHLKYRTPWHYFKLIQWHWLLCSSLLSGNRLTTILTNNLLKLGNCQEDLSRGMTLTFLSHLQYHNRYLDNFLFSPSAQLEEIFTTKEAWFYACLT